MNYVNEKLKIDMRSELLIWSTSTTTTSIIVFHLRHVVDFLGQFLRHFCY